jgi:chromosome segregation ATPase
MPESEWGEERIAELRRVAQRAIDADAACRRQEGSHLTAAESNDVFRGDANCEAVLSLLDALESERAQREALANAHRRRMGEIKKLQADLESTRGERDGFKEAFDDVMGALSAALDGDDMYGERPAEVVWKLRDQRDELNAEVTALRNGEDYDAEDSG